MSVKPPKKTQPYKIAIDFDGTIAWHEYPDIGDPVPGAFEWMKRFQAAGASLRLWTMRSDTEHHGPTLTQAVAFCQKNGIEFDHVNHDPNQTAWTSSPKLYSQIYIDDAAFGCPLIVEIGQYKPAVDWATVGPKVLILIELHNNPVFQ